MGKKYLKQTLKKFGLMDYLKLRLMFCKNIYSNNIQSFIKIEASILKFQRLYSLIMKRSLVTRYFDVLREVH